MENDPSGVGNETHLHNMDVRLRHPSKGTCESGSRDGGTTVIESGVHGTCHLPSSFWFRRCPSTKGWVLEKRVGVSKSRVRDHDDLRWRFQTCPLYLPVTPTTHLYTLSLNRGEGLLRPFPSNPTKLKLHSHQGPSRVRNRRGKEELRDLQDGQ